MRQRQVSVRGEVPVNGRRKPTAGRSSSNSKRRGAPRNGRAQKPVSPPDPEPAAKPLPADGERQSKSLLTRVVQISGLVSTLATVVGLIFVFAPNLKPEPPPAERSATFSEVSADANVSREDYLARIDRGPGDYTERQLRATGVVVSFDVSITGHKGETLPLRWGIYDAASGRQVYREKATTLTPEASVDQASAQVWAPLPAVRGSYYVLLQLFEEDGETVIDHARSPSFAGRAERAGAAAG